MAIERDRLWDSRNAVWSWADKMNGYPALWTMPEHNRACPTISSVGIYSRAPTGQGYGLSVPSRFGFRVVERWQFSFAEVAKSMPAAGPLVCPVG